MALISRCLRRVTDRVCRATGRRGDSLGVPAHWGVQGWAEVGGEQAPSSQGPSGNWRRVTKPPMQSQETALPPRLRSTYL